MFNTRIITVLGAVFGLILIGIIGALIVINPARDNGHVLAYRDGIGFDYDYYVEDTASGYVINLTQQGNISRDVPVQWFPDGRRIAYVTQDGAIFRIVIHDLRTGDITTVTEDNRRIMMLAISPSGEHIAFNIHGGAFSNGATLYHVADGTLSQLTVESIVANAADLKWSPDGRRLAVNLGAAVAFHHMDSAGAALYQNTAGCLPFSRFTWLPDSESILLTFGQELVRINAHDGTATDYDDPRIDAIIAEWDALTSDPLNNSDPCMTDMQTSPDGRWLAFDLWRYGHSSRPLILVDLTSDADPLMIGDLDEQITVNDWDHSQDILAVRYTPGTPDDPNLCELITINLPDGDITPVDFPCDSDSAGRLHLPGWNFNP